MATIAGGEGSHRGEAPYLGVSALAAAALLLESTLTRLLAVAQFYHFAFLVISLALLGFGASGTLLSLAPGLRRIPSRTLLAWSGIGFAVATGVAYSVVNWLPFDSYSIAWDPLQILYFGVYYLALTVPFLCAGVGIGAAVAGAHGDSHLVYAANLLGSAAGVVLAPALMWLAGVPGAVLASGLVALLPAIWGLYAVQTAGARPVASGWSLARLLLAGVSVAGVTGLVVLGTLNLTGNGLLGLTLSDYKGLTYPRRYPGSEHLWGRWDAISRIDVLAEAGTRLLPGLSYTYDGEPPHQLGVSVDGDSLLPVPLDRPEAFAAADFLPEAVAFDLRPGATALVLEPAGGLGVLQAAAGGASEMTAVSANTLLRLAVQCTNSRADPHGLPGVSPVSAIPRVYLAQEGAAYHLIYLPLTDAYRPVASGAYSLAETYMLTVEAFAAALARLQPDGILIVTRWLQIPPSEDLRLLATLITALEQEGENDPASALVAYRGIQTLTALVKPAGWTPAELAEVRAFARSRRYDLVWAPDIQPDEVNRYNRLAAPDHYEAVKALLAAADRRSYYRQYPFAVEPATDDRPFFFHFFRWAQTPAVLATLGRTWQPFGGSGYLILFALLALVLILSAVLILLPLLMHRPGAGSLRPMDAVTVAGYFGLLGIAYLCIEIPLIQRWLLAFGHATYAFTAVVLVVLLGSSLGSRVARDRRLGWLPLRSALLSLAVLALLTAVAGGALAERTLGWPAALRLAALACSLAPVAFLMGLPFPLGLAWLEETAPGLVSWAWAVNGCASVIASVLAAILALSYGFTAVLLVGAISYGLAAVLLPGRA